MLKGKRKRGKREVRRSRGGKRQEQEYKGKRQKHNVKRREEKKKREELKQKRERGKRKEKREERREKRGKRVIFWPIVGNFSPKLGIIFHPFYSGLKTFWPIVASQFFWFHLLKASHFSCPKSGVKVLGPFYLGLQKIWPIVASQFFSSTSFGLPIFLAQNQE